MSTVYRLRTDHWPPLYFQVEEGARAFNKFATESPYPGDPVKSREWAISFTRAVLECPYPENTMKAREWTRGFNQAYHLNLWGK